MKRVGAVLVAPFLRRLRPGISGALETRARADREGHFQVLRPGDALSLSPSWWDKRVFCTEYKGNWSSHGVADPSLEFIACKPAL